METLFSIAVGVSLAASCGLRAFMPLFVAGLMARLLQGTSFEVTLGGTFDWLASTPALIALGIAVVAEVAADKIPVFDNLLNIVQTPVRTGAGMLVCAAVMADVPTWATALTAVVAGGGAALGVHAVKSAVRLGSTAATGSTVNPLLSIGEDLVCLATAALSVVFVVCAVIVVLCTLVLFILAIRSWRKGRRESMRAEPVSEPPASPENPSPKGPSSP